MKRILRVDKPKGITSFDVIRILRKKLKVKKIGHAGTLDPLASGLMIVGVGKGTKELQDYIKLPKTYEVEMLLGEATTTGDMEGEVTEQSVVGFVDERAVRDTLSDMLGELQLPVPKYSAIKLGGERLYMKVRRGEHFVAPVKKMGLLSFKVRGVKKEHEYALIKMQMRVSSGSYIRSLIEELGRRLGYPASVKELRRTKVGKHGLLFAKRIKNTVRRKASH